MTKTPIISQSGDAESLVITKITIDKVHRSFPARVFGRIIDSFQSFRTSRKYWSFGSGSRIQKPAFVYGTSAIELGRNVNIWHHARIEAFNVLGIKKPKIVIGDGSTIHPYAHIGAALSITIGRGALFASNVYVTDHDHDYYDPDDPVITNRRVLAIPVVIGDYVWVGENAMVLKGVTIGKKSIIGAGSIVTRNIPPYSIAVGSPARVVKQWNPNTRTWEAKSDRDLTPTKCEPAS